MNANRAIAASLLLSLVSACVGAPPPPVPQPAPHPPLRPSPPLARPAPPPPADWRDAAATEGVWRWSGDGGRSVASYGMPGRDPVASLTCERASRTTILWRTGSATGPLPLVVTTPAIRKMLDASGEGAGGVSARISASDPLLDGIAFTRGRFMVELAGNPPLYLSAGAELSRVIEDCR